MTREEIEQMPAGRELDALVAVHALGWTETDYHGQRCFEWPGFDRTVLIHPGTDVALPQQSGLPAVLFDDPAWPPLPCYSTDIATAWKVVEHLRLSAAKYSPNIVYHHSTGMWHCEYFNATRMREAAADTAPLAICRAALLAATA